MRKNFMEKFGIDTKNYKKIINDYLIYRVFAMMKVPQLD